jgi:hypothetical protein
VAARALGFMVARIIRAHVDPTGLGPRVIGVFLVLGARKTPLFARRHMTVTPAGVVYLMRCHSSAPIPLPLLFFVDHSSLVIIVGHMFIGVGQIHPLFADPGHFVSSSLPASLHLSHVVPWSLPSCRRCPCLVSWYVYSCCSLFYG